MGHDIIPYRIDIDQRPAIGESRSCIADSEVDTIVGAAHRGGIFSIIERRSRYTLLDKLTDMAAVPHGPCPGRQIEPGPRARGTPSPQTKARNSLAASALPASFAPGSTSPNTAVLGNVARTRTLTAWCAGIFPRAPLSHNSATPRWPTCRKN